MPDQIHGIVGFTNKPQSNIGKHVDLPTIISAFKRINVQKIQNANVGGVADSTVRLFNEYNTIWQKSYYVRIIRSDRELDLIRNYILHNPLQLLLDREPVFRD